jgi:hypothetical protein
MGDKPIMKTTILLLILVSCGKDPVKNTSANEPKSELSSSGLDTSFCSGMTRQQCFGKCVDQIALSVNDCANMPTIETERDCRLGAIQYEKECTEAVLKFPRNDNVII